MDYQKITPANPLLHAVDAYCFYKVKDETAISDLYFPNGKLAIVFHFKNPFSYKSVNEQWKIMPSISFVCYTSAPVSLNSGGNNDTIAILLNPYSLYNIFNIKICSDIQVIDAHPFIKEELFHQLKVAENIEQRVNLLDAYFTEKLKNYNSENDLFKKLCDCIILNNGMVERQNIAKTYDISENYIHKLFMQRIGISFKPYAQIVRISNILQELYFGKKNDWFDILEKYGYYDQAHFIKDFKKITGTTPQQYYKLDRTFSDLFSAFA